MNVIQLLPPAVLATFLSGCALSSATAPLATDDCGPKPKDPGRIIAARVNSRCLSVSHGPFTADALKMSEPAKVAFTVLLARHVGWQVILGPENSRLVDFTETPSTRVIINRDQVISVTGSSFPF